MRDHSCEGQAGFTLLEMTISFAILAIMLSVLGVAVSTQTDLLAQSTDIYRTLIPAQSCLQRIRSELKAAVSLSPGYACSATSLTFRPVVGAILSTDGTYATKKAAGLVSANNIEYSSYTKTISYDATGRRVRMTVSGTNIPTGMRTAETLCENVEVFQLLNGDSTAATIPNATASTVLLLVRIEARQASVIASSKGAMVSSSLGGINLSTKIRVLPELLVNSQRGAVTGI